MIFFFLNFLKKYAFLGKSDLDTTENGPWKPPFQSPRKNVMRLRKKTHVLGQLLQIFTSSDNCCKFSSQYFLLGEIFSRENFHAAFFARGEKCCCIFSGRISSAGIFFRGNFFRGIFVRGHTCRICPHLPACKTTHFRNHPIL